MKHSIRGFTVAEVLLTILLIIVVAATSSFVTYGWQHNHINDLNKKISSLNSQINMLNSQVSTLSAQLNKTCQSGQQSDMSSTCASYAYTSPKGVTVLVFAPSKNANIKSPVTVIGEVPGNWSFEAQFPVQIKNSKGDIVAQEPANLLGSWQTTDLVPFSVQLTYTAAQSRSGTLVLQKDNPSGLPQNADSVSVPINF